MPTKKQTTPKAAASSTAPRYFDIAKPGTLPPTSGTTRPIIVSNRVVMQDPMMVASPAAAPSDLAAVSEDKPVNSSPTATKIVIKPLSEPAASDAADKTPEAAPAAEPTPAPAPVDPTPVDTAPKAAAPEAAPDTAPTSATVKQPPAEAAPPADAGSAGDSADVPENEAQQDAQEAARLEAEAKAQDELDGLVEQKEYFLPINSVEKRRSQHVFIYGTLLIVVLAAIWLDIALDAGFVHLAF